MISDTARRGSFVFVLLDQFTMLRFLRPSKACALPTARRDAAYD
jgi:hypothetical protein